MAVKLHRCSFTWFKMGMHPCWKVQKALDEQGVEYEVVLGPASRGKRDDLEKLSGQRLYPVIEFENGTVYREQSKEMAATISAGKLSEKEGAGGDGAAAPGEPPAAPGAAGPGAAAPREDAPGGSAPGETAPGDSAPGEGAPG